MTGSPKALRLGQRSLVSPPMQLKSPVSIQEVVITLDTRPSSTCALELTTLLQSWRRVPRPPLRAWQAPNPSGVPAVSGQAVRAGPPVPAPLDCACCCRQPAPWQPAPKAGGLSGEPGRDRSSDRFSESASTSFQHNITLALEISENLHLSWGI